MKYKLDHKVLGKKILGEYTREELIKQAKKIII